jgi:hypothetical protein
MSSDLRDDRPDLGDLALARVADGTLSDPETPALLRRIAREPLADDAAQATAPEAPAPARDSTARDFVLVSWEIRPGERRYRLARIPANVRWRIRIGAFERHLHRSFVIAGRRLRRFLGPASKAGLLARPGRAAGDLVLLDPASR